jgi:hypothetical protein
MLGPRQKVTRARDRWLRAHREMQAARAAEGYDWRPGPMMRVLKAERREAKAWRVYNLRALKANWRPKGTKSR